MCPCLMLTEIYNNSTETKAVMKVNFIEGLKFWTNQKVQNLAYVVIWVIILDLNENVIATDVNDDVR